MKTLYSNVFLRGGNLIVLMDGVEMYILCSSVCYLLLFSRRESYTTVNMYDAGGM